MADTQTELYKRVMRLERQVASLERRAKAYGWQLSSMFNSHIYGGGELVWKFDGHTRQVGGCSTPDRWSENFLDYGDYKSTTYGGPYIDLNGSDEYLDVADGNWQDTDTEEYLVWGWAYARSFGANRAIAAKWDTTGGAWRCWRLWYANGSTDFAFTVSAGGAVGTSVISTYGGPAVDTWYFVAGYFDPSALLRIYVGANTDATLTIDSLAAGVPASIYAAGSADLTIGAYGDPGTYWNGNIGIVAGRGGVSDADIDDHVNMLFHRSRDFYEE